MIKLFKPKKILLLIDKNEMELIDLLTNTTFRAKSDFDFSKDSLHIAEFSIAEKLLEELITKHFGKRIFRPNLDILVQPILKNNEWLSSVEKRLFHYLLKISLWQEKTVRHPLTVTCLQTQNNTDRAFYTP